MLRIKRYRVDFLIETLFRCLYWWWRIRSAPYAQWQQHIDTRVREARPGQSRHVLMARCVGRYIAMWTRHSPLHFNCLCRSLALSDFLDKRNITSQVVVGVKLEQAEFKAHAWVTVADELINDDAETVQQYRVVQAAKPLNYMG